MWKSFNSNGLARLSGFGTLRVTEREQYTEVKATSGIQHRRKLAVSADESGEFCRIVALTDEVVEQKGTCMQQMEQQSFIGRVDQEGNGAVQAMPVLGRHTESLAQVAHDARNMVTALNLYCDLLQEPGVLTPPFSHYGNELKLVAATSRVLVEKLAALNATSISVQDTALNDSKGQAFPTVMQSVWQHTDKWRFAPAVPIDNLAADVLANRNLLAMLAGSTVGITIDVEGGAMPVRLTGENLTRILVNLVKNAVEAMSSVGRVHISLREGADDPGLASWLTLNVEDNGPGFPDRILPDIFELSEKLRTSLCTPRNDWHVRQRGLGLSITRSLVEAAGGRMSAANRDPVGACIQIELPVRNLDVPGQRQETSEIASLN
jgi:signal transduction histidine kinase